MGLTKKKKKKEEEFWDKVYYITHRLDLKENLTSATTQNQRFESTDAISIIWQNYLSFSYILT